MHIKEKITYKEIILKQSLFSLRCTLGYKNIDIVLNYGKQFLVIK